MTISNRIGVSLLHNVDGSRIVVLLFGNIYTEVRRVRFFSHPIKSYDIVKNQREGERNEKANAKQMLHLAHSDHCNRSINKVVIK